MAFKVFVLVTLALSGALARYTPSADEPQLPAEYSFNYGVADVDSAVNFVHGEARDGDLAQGSYTIQLPDSRIQKVTYTVDGDSGYVAEVTYEGEAVYPDQEPSGRYA